MADFRPFQAWRFQSQKVRPQDVMAPPYDVISKEEQQVLYSRSPYNCIRLILNKEEPADTEINNRYTRARDFFNAWKKEGILIQDEKPGYYLYRQIFACPERRENFTRFSLLGRLKVEPFTKGVVIPHEKTLSKPREDRRRLLEMTGTNFSPVFCLYENTTGEIQSIQKKIAQGPSLVDTRDDRDVRHTLWHIAQDDDVAKIHEILSREALYIADGHHRYQTALEYAQKRHETKNIPGDEVQPFDFVLMALVEFEDPGLVLMATHRIVLGFEDFRKEKALEKLRLQFEVKSIAPKILVKEFDGLKKGDPSVTDFGLLLGPEEAYHLILKDPKEVKKILGFKKPEVWYGLDVNVLAHAVFSKLWGLTEEKWEAGLRFTHATEEAVQAASKKEVAAVFLLRPPNVKSLKEMGQAKELMPQKSTYFYPKLASGLVFFQHE
ncbi:MAG: DUF1015 domain-containing protein [Candidatus Omnitrophica bacterium]|nr:DUF1015 domain-containing protein [Candidatus Omnitrophota bacterium]